MEVPLKPEPKFRPMRIVKFFGIPLLVIGCVVGLIRVGYTLREWQGQWKLTQVIEDLESKGIDTNSEAIELAYHANTSEKDAQAWLDLLAKMDSVEFKEAAQGVPNFDSSVETDEWGDNFDTSATWKYAQVSIQFVERQQDLIHRIRELAAAPQPVRFPIRFASLNTLLPEVQNSRGLARLLWLDAQVALHLGDSQRALDDFIALHNLSRHVEAVPFAICLVVSKAFKSMALTIAQEGIEQDLFSDQQLQDIDDVLARNCDIGDEWNAYCERELGMCIPVFLDPALASEKSKKPLPARGHDAIYFINMLTQLADTPTEDWELFYKTVSQQELKFNEDVRSWWGRVDLVLTGLFLPAMTTLADSSIDTAQHYRQARYGVALRLFQHKHGKFPQSLAELPPFDRSMSAFKQQSFGYVLTPKGATLWGGKFKGNNPLISPTIPPTDQQTQESLDNRGYVWSLEIRK